MKYEVQLMHYAIDRVCFWGITYPLLCEMEGYDQLNKIIDETLDHPDLDTEKHHRLMIDIKIMRLGKSLHKIK